MKRVLVLALAVVAVACGSNWIIPEPPANDASVADAGPDTEPGCPIEEPETPVDAGTPEEPDAGAPEKSCLCHIPKGNPGNAHTICVGDPAVEAHLNHGDYLGSCVEEN